MKAGLFKSGYESSVGSQFGGSKVVTIVATALNKHKSDLLVYLCQEVKSSFSNTVIHTNPTTRISKSSTKH